VAPALTGGTVQFFDNAVALGSPVALAGGQAQLATSVLAVGSHSITATYSGTTNYSGSTSSGVSVTVNMPSTPYADWAAGTEQGLTAGVNDGPMDDPDHDGISNLLEFVLGGKPMEPSQAILPKLTHADGAWVFEYDRSDLSLAPPTIQVVEHGNDLTGWTAVAIPADSAGSVTITPGATTDHVKVTLPGPASELFVRLKVWQ
jgi:hypothetical protein